MIGALCSQLFLELVDLERDGVDEPEGCLDVPPPGLGECELVEEHAAFEPEQVRDGTGVPEASKLACTRFFKAVRCPTR
jgi:hypothetical protein